LVVGDLVRAHFPQSTLLARARDVTHWYGLHSRGVPYIERETLDSALLSGRSVLELMGWERHAARTQALRFRQHTLDLLLQMAPHQGDEKKLISTAKQGRLELEQMWSREREERARQKGRRGAGFGADAPEPPAPPAAQEPHSAP
jgi:glutathione-regulated potassium-efflux system ancillary protein KefC